MFPVVVVAAVAQAPAAEPPVRVESLTDGYRVILTRSAAERFRAGLDRVRDEKALADTLRDVAKGERDKDPDSETAATLETVAMVVGTQVPALKKALDDGTGPNGATIRVYGVKRDTILKRPRPRLRKLIEAAKGALPDDTRATVTGVMEAARTTPLMWTVEPRK